jgi:hypothetical protein
MASRRASQSVHFRLTPSFVSIWCASMILNAALYMAFSSGPPLMLVVLFFKYIASARYAMTSSLCMEIFGWGGLTSISACTLSWKMAALPNDVLTTSALPSVILPISFFSPAAHLRDTNDEYAAPSCGPVLAISTEMS